MSTTLAGSAAPPRDVDDLERNPRLRRIAAACAGPVVIVAGVLFALRGFAFHPLLTNHQPDILSFWLPRWTFLGRSLAAGHVPLWNPFEMLGYRFAADPQSGWLYAPPMLLFSVLSPGAAMRSMIVANPLLAGLGLFWFLRKDSLSRPAATAGGLSLAMLMSTSEMAIEMPFAGFLAWTTIVLVGASGYRQATQWSARLAWLALSAFAFSQVASAHMSHGLVMCSLLVVAYLAADAALAVRGGRLAPWTALGHVALFVTILPLASLPVLYPRLAFIGSSSLHRGYDALGTPRLSGPNVGGRPIATNGVWAAWPLAFGVAPGAYAGAVMLLAIPFAFLDRVRRAIVWAFAGAAALTWVLMLNVVVTARWFVWLMLKLPFGDVYLHNPGRMRYLSMIAIPVLGAVGLQRLRDVPIRGRAAKQLLGGGVVVLLVLPLLVGGRPIRFILLAVAMLVAVPTVYWLATGRQRWATTAVVVVLGVELVASAVYSNVYRGGTVFTGLESGQHANLIPQVLRYPDLAEATFLRPTRFVDTLRGQHERYLTYAPPASNFDKGYLFAQRPGDWPALAMERGTLFGIPDVLGYNPVQLPRYWTYIRAIDANSVFYNAAVVQRPTLGTIRLTGTRYEIVPRGTQAIPQGRVVANADDYDLVQIYGWEPRVSVVPAWTVVARPNDALQGVRAVGFDPSRTALLETDPGIVEQPGGEAGRATYQERSPEDVRIDVDAPAASIVVVRNSYDPGWTATVDGRSAPVLATDYLVQGVPVPPGHHDVRLTYRDPDVSRGLAAGSVVWLTLLLTIPASLVLERRRRARPSRGGDAP